MPQYVFKIIVCGDYAVGKTTLLRRYTELKFTEDYLPTLGVNMLRKEMEFANNKVKLMLWDVAGQELYAQVREQFYVGTKGAILVYDVTRPESFVNISKWRKEILDVVKNPVYCILVGNKIDLEHKVTTEEGKKLAKELNMPFLETSARTGTGIEKAFSLLIENLLKEQKSKDK